MQWLRRSDALLEPSKSPSSMETTYPPLVFIDGSGSAAGNAVWILEADLSNVEGEPTKYWITPIVGDIPLLMNQAQQDQADADEATAQLDSDRAIAVDVPSREDALGIESTALIQLLNKRDNYLTNRIIELQDQMAAIVASSGAADTIRSAVASVPNSATATRDRSAAIADYKAETAAGINDY